MLLELGPGRGQWLRAIMDSELTREVCEIAEIAGGRGGGLVGARALLPLGVVHLFYQTTQAARG